MCALLSLLHSRTLTPMARLWGVSVLLLLLLSSPGVSPFPAQHLCGSHLVDALYFVCGKRGFFADSNHRHKRDVEDLLGEASLKCPNCGFDRGGSVRDGVTLRTQGGFVSFCNVQSSDTA